jgi:hypothetical protein
MQDRISRSIAFVVTLFRMTPGSLSCFKVQSNFDLSRAKSPFLACLTQYRLGWVAKRPLSATTEY